MKGPELIVLDPASQSRREKMKNLTQEQVDELAFRYGLDPADHAVIESAEQADAYHGTKIPEFDGNMKRFWCCDKTGHMDAYRTLDGYLDQIATEWRIDSLAAAEFERNAYGH
jgi:hypothetical protein